MNLSSASASKVSNITGLDPLAVSPHKFGFQTVSSLTNLNNFILILLITFLFGSHCWLFLSGVLSLLVRSMDSGTFNVAKSLPSMRPLDSRLAPSDPPSLFIII